MSKVMRSDGKVSVFGIGVSPFLRHAGFQQLPFAGISWANEGLCGRVNLAGEAQAGSAGEQPAQEYPVETHPDECGEPHGSPLSPS